MLKRTSAALLSKSGGCAEYGVYAPEQCKFAEYSVYAPELHKYAEYGVYAPEHLGFLEL